MPKGKLLNAQGTFKCDFYHGTSSLFVDSIRESGLGGHNPVRDLGLADYFKQFFELGERTLSDTNVWQSARENLLDIAEQRCTRNGIRFNFSHGRTYITPFARQARAYAEIGDGCEMLHYLKIMVQLLRYRGLTQEVDQIMDGQIESMLERNYRGVVIRIRNLRFRDVESEIGKNKNELLKHYEIYFRDRTIKDPYMQCWVLTNTIPSAQLEFTYL